MAGWQSGSAVLLQACLVRLDGMRNRRQDTLVIQCTKSHTLGPTHLRHQSVTLILRTKLWSVCADRLAVFVANLGASTGTLTETIGFAGSRVAALAVKRATEALLEPLLPDCHVKLIVGVGAGARSLGKDSESIKTIATRARCEIEESSGLMNGSTTIRFHWRKRHAMTISISSKTRQ
jgi:hypothetical protein